MTFDHRPSRPGTTPASAGRGSAGPTTGPRWRQWVRWTTAGVTGAAGVGAIALTVGLAQAAAPTASADPVDDPAAGSAPSPAATGAPLTRPDAAPRTAAPAPSSAAPAITAPPALVPPVRTPTAGQGHSHARSGGS